MKQWTIQNLDRFLFISLFLIGLIAASCKDTITDKGLTKLAPLEKNKPVEIMIFARQFKWTVWYPGNDRVFGEWDRSLISSTNVVGRVLEDKNGTDDVLIDGETFHLIKNVKYKFIIHSQDVIHSLYMPHYRISQNAIPGQITAVEFTPEETTVEKREALKDMEIENARKEHRTIRDSTYLNFNYVMLCNKICGSGHYQMNMQLVVDDPTDFQLWWNSIQP